MGLFSRRQPDPEVTRYDPALFEPVIRASICTGERVACMREKDTGKLHELMLIRTEQDLKQFAADYGVDPSEIQTVY